MKFSILHFHILNAFLVGSTLFVSWQTLKESHVDRKLEATIPVPRVDRKRATTTTTSLRAPSSCLDPNGPTPVILMSLGRSGTHSTWQVMGNLTGMETYPLEWPAVNAERITERLKTFDAFWIDKKMCQRQTQNYQKDEEENSDEGESSTRRIPDIVGFNWKPSLIHFQEFPVVQQALQMTVNVGRKNPKQRVYVVRNRRNLLDVHLSRVKHQQAHKANLTRLPPHCHSGSKWCVSVHARTAKDLEVPDLDNLYETLKKLHIEEDQIDLFLAMWKVPTVHVSYDRLYYPSSQEEGAREWNSIFTLLGRRSNWTYPEIQSNMEHIPSIKARRHSEFIANFDAMAGALEGTEFEHLLRH